MAAQEYTLEQLVPLVQQEAARQGLDPQIALQSLISENTADGTYNPARKVRSDTVSPQGAVGVMQVLPPVFQNLRAQGLIPKDGEISDVQTNITAAVALLKQQSAQFQSMDPTILAIGYHGGPAAVKAYQTDPLSFAQNNPKTAQYAEKAARARASFAGASGTPTPSVAGFSFDRAIALNNEATKQASQLTDMLTSMIGQFDANKQAGGAAIQQVADASVAGTQADAVGAQAALAGQKQVLAKTGLDIGDSNSFIAQKLQELSGHSQTIRDLTPKLQEAKAANPFLNPVGWIMGQLQARQLESKINSASSLMALANDEIQQRRVLAKDLQGMVPQATQESIAMRERANIDLARAKAKLEDVRWNAENAGMRVRLLLEPFSINTNLFNQNASMLRLFADKLGLEAMQNAKDDEQHRLDQANIAMQFVTGTAKKFFASPKDLAGFEANPKNRELLERLRTGGMSPGLYVAGVDQLGNVEQLRKTDPMRGQFTQELMNSVWAELQRGVPDPTTPTIRKPYKGSEIEQTEAATRNVIARWQKELKDGDPARMSPDNPYKMNASVYASAPGLENNHFSNFVQDQAAKGLKNFTEKDLWQELQIKVQAFPDKKAELVRDFSEFISRGRAYQQGAYGLATIGMPADRTVGYKFQIRSPGLFSEGKTVDFENPVEVEHGLMGAIQSVVTPAGGAASYLDALRAPVKAPGSNVPLDFSRVYGGGKQ